VTSYKSEIALRIRMGARLNPEKYSWKLIKGGHVLHDDSPE
jgi:hypothetical protein